jgi:hypothetical protein
LIFFKIVKLYLNKGRDVFLSLLTKKKIHNPVPPLNLSSYANAIIEVLAIMPLLSSISSSPSFYSRVLGFVNDETLC